jgi:hypothetical protein
LHRAANTRHREERSDAAIQSPETRPFFKAFGSIATLDGFAPLAMTFVGELANACLEAIWRRERKDLQM